MVKEHTEEEIMRIKIACDGIKATLLRLLADMTQSQYVVDLTHTIEECYDGSEILQHAGTVAEYVLTPRQDLRRREQ